MIDTQSLVDKACERAEADDFGSDSWREGLGVLVAALTREGDLNELGEAVFSRPDRRLPGQSPPSRAVL